MSATEHDVGKVVVMIVVGTNDESSMSINRMLRLS